MPLTEYRQKRKFSQTPEPQGDSLRREKKVHHFFIQKHQASHLHYDFRLEIEDVLKSWAIPKGPSMNPADKRLAMMVEDHPYEYGTFEGNIPQGNYGAGTVMLWDQGVFYVPGIDEDYAVNETELLKMLDQGNIKLFMNGKKIKGEYALVKTPRAHGEGNGWLLIKKKDAFSVQESVTNYDRSVLTNRNLNEIKLQADADKEEWHSPVNKHIEVFGAPRKKMPTGVKPMLAELTDLAFDDPGWIFEIKWDGYRTIAEVNYNTATIYSRNLISFDQTFKPVQQSLQKIGCQAIFDGEIVVLNEKGISEFSLIQNYRRNKNGHLVYYIFDILYLNEHDLTRLPLEKRKQILQQVIPDGDIVLRYCDHIKGIGRAFFSTAKENGLEGIMAKRLASIYQPGKRVKDWLKVKITHNQEAVIVGYTEPKKSRKKFGALVLGVYEKESLRYIGRTGGGFDEESLDEVYAKLEGLKTDHSPFSIEPKINRTIQWVKPELVCEVKFQEWTGDGHMRLPIFLGLREDKAPSEVTWERSAKENLKFNTGRKVSDRIPSKQRAGFQNNDSFLSDKLISDESLIQKDGGAELSFPGVLLKVTHLNKILWPEKGYTKRDLLEYYHRISPLILPYLKDRPESLRRNPNGITQTGFFQKDMPSSTPDWVRLERVYSESNKTDIHFLICNDEATLLYMANLGCIELNPWNSRLQNLRKPDYLVIDLDPKNVAFEGVVDTALAVKDVLDRAEIVSYPKTSGSRGLHIYIPLAAKYDYEQVKDFAHVLVKLVHQLVPGLTSLERMPAKRKHPIYLDYLQNRYGQTLAAAYCLRPKTGATVSTPLFWEEVKYGLDPKVFNIKTIFERVEKLGDIFKPVLSESIDMGRALGKLT